MADLKPKLNLAPILSDSFYQLTDIPQGVLPLKALEQQVLALKHNRDYVFSTHQQIWRPPTKLDDTCIKSICQASRFTSKDGHSQQITMKKQDQNTACHKIEFNNQEAETGLKTENFEIRIDKADGLKKENKKKNKKKSTQTKKERSKPDTEKKVHTRRSRNYWLPKEDEMLLELRKAHGDQWTKIASCLEGRTGKQVRDRYLNYLKPSIKQKTWSKYEEELLDMLYKTFGNKWSTIASYLPGRTENQVKNRFYAGVKRGKYHKNKKMNAQKEEAEQTMKFAKLDPEFENRLLVFKSEDVSSLIPLNAIKSEAFETCDSVSQSSQVISKGKRMNTDIKNEEEEYNIQTKNSTSCLGNFCIKEEFDPETARNQRTLSRESMKSDISSKTESLRLKEEERLMKIEEDLIHGYKKIKCEIKAEIKYENSDNGNIAYCASNELLAYQSY